MEYLCKVNGDFHVHDGPSRPNDEAEWEGKELEIPLPRKLTKGASIAQLSIGDDIWVWTHEDKNYGNGFGLTARARIGGIRTEKTSYGEHAFVVMKNVELLKPHFRLEEIPKGESGSRAIEAIRDHRHHQAIEMDGELLLEFLSAVEKVQAKKRDMFRQYNDPNLHVEPSELDALFQDKMQIKENFASRRYSLQEMRPEQSRFRSMLLTEYHGTCVVTGCQTKEVIQAAHIVPFSKGREFRDSLLNGLLLRADIHLLFDRQLISINPQTSEVCIAACLQDTEYQELDGKYVDHHASRDFLDCHWQEFKDSNVP